MNANRRIKLSNDEDIYGALGQTWWEQTGEEVRATPQQIRFAAARYSGATRSKAAALAGYSGDAQALRSAGSRTDDSDTVKSLIAMAAAAEAGTVESQYTVAQAKLKVGNLVKHSRDALIVFKGTEVLARLERDEAEANAKPEESLEETLAALICSVPESGVGAFLSMASFFSNANNLVNHPFLRQTAPIVAKFYPTEWAEWRNKHREDWRSFLDEMAKGQLLEGDELNRAVKAKVPTIENIVRLKDAS